MADFAQRRHKKAVSSNNNNRSNGFASKNMYEDVFGGAPKFSSRVEDYSEIFSSYNNSSRTSSIPFLDLPPVTDDEVQSSTFDYLEIFGGYDSVDYGVSYQELFVDDCRTTAGDSSSSSSEDVWTPAETGSPSEESSENPVSLECNQAFSTIESYDGVKQFNVSYHKTNQISTEDGISGTTHIAQLNAVPAYTFVVDQNPPVQKDKSDNSQPEIANDSSSNANIADLRMDGEHFWEKPPQPASASDQKPQKNLDGNGIYVEKPFVTVSEISLRTQPSEVPPPTRPPPKFAIKHESHKFMALDRGSSAKYARQKTASRISPPFFDVEVDSSSSAAASAAAMKDAMEKAQATLKSAKEMMERRMDGLQRKKMGLKESSKVKDRKEGGIAHDVINGKEDSMKIFEREERQKGVGLVQVASQFEVKPKFFNVSKESADDKHSKQCRLTQEFQHVGEWKAEEQYYELVKKDPVETLFVAPELKRSERLLPGEYQNEQKEKKAERLPFVQQEISSGKFEEAKRVVCGLEEDKNRVNVGKEGGERVEHENMKTDEIVCEREEYDKRRKEALNLKEAERKLKKTCEQEKKTALEQEEQEKLKESREREENEKRRKEAFVRDENERRQKEAREKEEYESRLREIQERKENEKRLKEAREREETERRLKEAREREESERTLKEAREREENERRLKEAREREENERRLKEAREREENERRLKEAREREENERRLKEAREREENERLLKEAREREENERLLKEAREREENERRLKEAQEKEENERRMKEAREKEESERRMKEAREKEESERREAQEREENERRLREAREREENERRLKEVREKEEHERRQKEAQEREKNERREKEAHEREENLRKQKEQQEMEEKERRLEEAHEREENAKRLKEDSEREQIETHQRKLTENVGDNEGRLKEVRKQEKELVGLAMHDQQGAENRHTESCEEVAFSQKDASGRMETENRVRNSEEWNEPGTAPHVCSGEEKSLKAEKIIEEVSQCEEIAKAVNDAGTLDEAKNSNVTCGGHEQEGIDTTVKLDPESCTSEEHGRMKTAQNAIELRESTHNCKEAEVSSEQDKDERLTAAWITQCSSEHEASVYNQIASSKTKVDDNEKGFGKFENAVRQEKDEQCIKENLVGLDCVDINKNIKGSQKLGQSDRDGIKTEVELINEEEKRTRPKSSAEFNINQDKKERNQIGFVAREGSGKEGRIAKEREQEKERLRKLEEDIQREREREKDRMAVERMSREACERAFAETRERAERAAVERATAEARQRAMAEAREKLEKACAEAREKSLAEKANTEARLRAERAAVERATAEARERAEKAMAERAAMEARGRTERSVSEKYSAASRDRGLRQSTSFSSVRDAQFQGSSSFSSSQRYSNSSNHSDKNQGIEVESAQRCKARLERHQRTVERAAKALEEKNLRDYLAQREQAERNRFSETLDADVKRWSSGKEGNLRALLSTLQYILGTESGWHPIPLTDVVTAVAVKKAYRKATLCVHPDKLQQRGASIQQKYVCEKVFDLLKDAWNKFNSEER